MTTRAAAKSKNKKPLETTLGKAPAYAADDPIDLSHIRKPIDTSIFGLTQVLNLFETATEEVRKYIAYECDIMYECRICRTIFRSLANFILHKRNYCRESYNRNDHTNCRNNCQENEFAVLTSEEGESNSSNGNKKENTSGTTSPIPPKCDSKKMNEHPHSSNENLRDSKKSLNYILNRLQNKQESALITEQCLLEDVSNESKNSEEEDAMRNNVVLERVTDSNSAVFQTMFQNMINEIQGNYMKTEVMEIHDILDHNEAILGRDGRIVPSEYEKNASFTCTVCNHKFSTKKTLTYHIKYKHNSTRLLYQCPECRDTFANAWSVFRHLYKIHRKTSAQVKRLRNQIHASVIKRDEQPEQKITNASKANAGLISDTREKVDIENQQWMDDLEGDNDLQRCGGCGRKFERKAALHSHSQFCSKRIAVCNSIKESSAKRVQAEEKQTIDKSSKNSKGINSTNLENTVKGSQRRKPQNSHKMYRIDYVKNIEKNGENSRDDDKILEIALTRCENEQDNTAIDKETNETDDPDLALQLHSETIKGKDQILRDRSESRSIDEVIDEHAINTEDLPGSSTDSSTSNDNLFVANQGDTLIENDNSVSTVEVNNLVLQEEIVNSEGQNQMNVEINSLENFELDEKVIDHTNEVECWNAKRKYDELPTESSPGKKIKIESDSTNPETPVKSLQLKSLKYIDKRKKLCIPCNKAFKTYKTLMRHMAIHFSWYRFQCNKCSFKSYNKYRCETHAEIKHGINDKEEVNNYIVQISSTTTLKLSTEFTEYCKTRKKNTTKKKKIYSESKLESSQVLAIKENEEEKVEDDLQDQDQQVVNSDRSAIPDDNQAKELNPENSTLRKMIMEVIFGSGSSPSASKESLLSEWKLKTLQNEEEGFHGFENSSAETQTAPTTPLKDNSRPVRNRVPVVQKDFLYDMAQLLKSKPAVKEKEINAVGSQKELNVVKKTKSIKTYMKDSKMKKVTQTIVTNGKKPLVPSKSTVEPETNVVQDVNMNSKDLLKKHITGDCD